MKSSQPMNKDFKKQLIVRSQKLKPVVILGNHGLSANVIKEIDSSLEAHELIKVRVNAADKEERNELIEQILTTSHAELVQAVGHVISIYRKKKEA